MSGKTKQIHPAGERFAEALANGDLVAAKESLREEATHWEDVTDGVVAPLKEGEDVNPLTVAFTPLFLYSWGYCYQQCSFEI